MRKIYRTQNHLLHVDPTHFLRVCRPWQQSNSRSHHYFFNLKNLRVFFVLKPGENSFARWPARVRFGSGVHIHMIHANRGVGFRPLQAMKICTVFEYLFNNIECNFNIAILSNFWKQARNIVLLGTGFDTKNSFGCCVGNFGDLSAVFRGHKGMP